MLQNWKVCEVCSKIVAVYYLNMLVWASNSPVLLSVLLTCGSVGNVQEILNLDTL